MVKTGSMDRLSAELEMQSRTSEVVYFLRQGTVSLHGGGSLHVQCRNSGAMDYSICIAGIDVLRDIEGQHRRGGQADFLSSNHLEAAL